MPTVEVNLNGAPVLELSLSLPVSGAWSADIQVASGKALAAGARASLELPGLTLEGFVKRSGVFGDRAQLRVTGGALDWQSVLPAKNYQKTDVATVLADMGVSTDQPVTNPLDFWSRPSGTTGQALQQVADYLGLPWRINPDGTVRLRAEAPQSVNPGAIELKRDEVRGMVDLALERAVVLPGCLVGSDTVGDVLYTASGELRCRYFVVGSGTGGFRNQLEKLIRWVTRDTLYLGTYTAEVSSQAADGTLDLMPFDSRIRSTGFQSIPIRHGMAGVKELKVPPGELVMLAFDGGSPAKPYASLFYSGKVTKMVLDIESLEVGGTLAVAVAQLVASELSRMASVFDSHTHILAVSVGTGTAAPPAAPMSPIADIESKKLKTQ